MGAYAYRNCLLTVLAIILAFNFVDRLALGILLQDIKTDLNLSDTQLGLLTGFVFAVFYAVMGIPIARWADRGNRVAIITLTTALWSAAVALCAVAGSFVQMILIRMVVAVGEAGCIPPAHSLIADYFNRAERARAVSLYMLGGPFSFLGGYFLAGWLNELYGWRMTFVLLGLPGLGLAALAATTLREPRRATAFTARSAKPSLKEVFATLGTHVTFRQLLLCISVAYFFGNGIMQWQPAFFIRTYGLQTGEVGTWFAVIWGLGGLLGTYCGGQWASRRAAHNETLQLKVMAVAYCAFGILSIGIYLAPHLYVALATMAAGAIGISAITGPMFGLIQTLVPAHMRAMSIALIYLCANLIGMGLGPLAVGVLSDTFRSWAGEESLRYALLTLSPGYLWCSWHLLRANRSLVRDLDAVAKHEHAT
jgi:MFS family permease